ncbi:hypothetical protein Tco_1193347 [Tanacetum coccineum]
MRWRCLGVGKGSTGIGERVQGVHIARAVGFGATCNLTVRSKEREALGRALMRWPMMITYTARHCQSRILHRVEGQYSNTLAGASASKGDGPGSGDQKISLSKISQLLRSSKTSKRERQATTAHASILEKRRILRGIASEEHEALYQPDMASDAGKEDRISLETAASVRESIYDQKD